MVQLLQTQPTMHQARLGAARQFHAVPRVLGGCRHAPWVCRWGPDKRDGLLPPGFKLPTLPALPSVSLPSLPGVALDLSKPQAQTTAFGVLSVTSGLLAAAALIAPELLLSTLLPTQGPADIAGLDPTLLRVAGATLVISAAVEYCLQDAAANNRLSSATYQRLMIACVFKSTGYLLAFALAEPAWTPLLMATYPTAAALSIALNLSVLWATNKDASGNQTVPNLVPALAPTNTASWVYSGCVLLYLATAAACYAPTDSPSLFIGETGGASSQLLQHTWAPGFLLAAVASLNLKDAADRGRLGAGTFKRLNLGLGLLELIYSSVFVGALATRTAAGDFAGLSNLAFSLGIAGFCINQWLYASKNK